MEVQGIFGPDFRTRPQVMRTGPQVMQALRLGQKKTPEFWTESKSTSSVPIKGPISVNSGYIVQCSARRRRGSGPIFLEPKLM
jgi:hypothetical protein